MTTQPSPTWPEFLAQKLGSNRWVIARRTKRIIERYGEDVVCLSHAMYASLEREWECLVYGAPVKLLHEAAADMLAALIGICDAERTLPVNTADPRVAAFLDLCVKGRAAIAKATGGKL